jgi:hypothetical protein
MQGLDDLITHHFWSLWCLLVTLGVVGIGFVLAFKGKL